MTSAHSSQVATSFERPDYLFRLLGEQSKEHSFILLDTDGRILWWSPSAERIFGAASSEVTGEPIARFFTPEDVARGIPEHELALARLDSAAEDDRWMTRIDGSRFWASGAAFPLRDEKGDLIAFAKILRDRTDMRSQLDSLRNQTSAIVESDRHKSRFFCTLSHELRSPLAPLAHAAHLLRMKANKHPDLEAPVEVIERQVGVLQHLVDDLLDVNRIGNGKIRLGIEAVVLQDVMRDAVETTAGLFEKSGAELYLVPMPGPVRVRGDAKRLHQVFVNLLSNAAKYTPAGGRVWFKLTVEDDEAVVRVEDTGVGIPHDMLPRIFELFTQVEATRPQSRGGLGIGLSLVKSLVDLHGGTVQAQSPGVGKGSEFAVRLPLAA